MKTILCLLVAMCAVSVSPNPISDVHDVIDVSVSIVSIWGVCMLSSIAVTYIGEGGG